MSNNQVERDPIQIDQNAEYQPSGKLDDPISTSDELGDYEDDSKGINVPGDNVALESVKGNEVSQRELSDISTDNIIDEPRSTKSNLSKDVYQKDKEADEAVNSVLESNDGTSAIRTQ